MKITHVITEIDRWIDGSMDGPMYTVRNNTVFAAFVWHKYARYEQYKMLTYAVGSLGKVVVEPEMGC